MINMNEEKRQDILRGGISKGKRNYELISLKMVPINKNARLKKPEDDEFTEEEMIKLLGN